MLSLVFSPKWFYGVDIIFEILGIIVALLIAFYSFRIYRFSGKENTNHIYLGLSFLAIAASFAAKVMTNFVLYYQTTVKQEFGTVIVKYHLLEKSNLFFQVGYDLHRFLMLLGLFGVYWLVSKSRDVEHQFLFAYLFFIIAIFSFQSFVVFHVTAAVILFMIVKHYLALCKGKSWSRGGRNARINLAAFMLIALSQVVFIFTVFNTLSYVIGEVLQFAGLVLFLVNIILVLVLTHGRKATHAN